MTDPVTPDRRCEPVAALRGLRYTVGVRTVVCFVLPATLLAAAACASGTEHELYVTATAYNSLPGQTQGDPSVGAWGDRLAPGMKAIAVSRDLLHRGIRRGTRVRIEGLRGEYVVLDKMAPRWKRKIDIYMGRDEEAARAWGRRRVRIRWRVE